MVNEPKMHHYIPEFYLSGFTPSRNKDDYLYVFDITNGENFKVRPKNIGKQKDYYKLDADDIDPYIVEKVFSTIESGTAPVLKRTIKENKLPLGEDFKILIYFLALLSMRTPSFRKIITNLLKDMASMTAQLTFSTKERYEAIVAQMKNDGKELNDNISYEEMKKFIDSDRYDIKVSKNWQVYWILEAVDIILPKLHERNWSLVKINDSSLGNFICSDRPVSLTWVNENKSFWGPGFGLEDTILLMPLSSRFSLLGMFERTKKRIKADLRTISDFNSRIGLVAERFIYSTKNRFNYMKPDGKIGDSDYLMEQYRKKKNRDSNAVD